MGNIKMTNPPKHALDKLSAQVAIYVKRRREKQTLKQRYLRVKWSRDEFVMKLHDYISYDSLPYKKI